MPHLALVGLSGCRIRDTELERLGLSMPGVVMRAEAVGALPCLGLLTLAGLTPDDWSQDYHEATAVTDELVHAIVRERPTLVAISALTASIDEAYALSERLRAEGLATVLGGLHVTTCADEAQRHASAIVVGEAERVWTKVLDDAARGALRPMYRADQPFDLADAPVPNFALLGDTPRPRFTLQTARGCPLGCEFCGASRLLGRFREKPIECVARELDAIRRIDQRPLLELADDNTFAGRRSPTELFETLASSGARYFTEADWRIGERPEVLEGLAASGCVQVLIGIESLVPRFHGMGAKSNRVDRIMRAVHAIQSSGVAVAACFIVGADGETRYDLQRLADFLVDAEFADVQLTLQTPYPGTRLHDRLRDSQRLLPDRGWASYTLFDVTFRPDPMSVEDLASGFRTLVEQVYSPEIAATRRRRRRDIWSARRS